MNEVRALAESEYRQAHELFMRALLEAPGDDQNWERARKRYEPGRVFGIDIDGELAGTAMSMHNSLRVPGGTQLPAAAVTGVGVRADRTRRGLLTALMRRQLDDALARGEACAMLHASEAVIYERFGYGIATPVRDLEIDRRRARMRDTAPRGGQVRLVPADHTFSRVPALYEACRPERPGMIDRPAAWWPARQNYLGSSTTLVVHSTDSDVDDGYALYEPKNGQCGTEATVYDLIGSNPTATSELWRFLLELDLVVSIRGRARALDEPVEDLLTDPRACRTCGIREDLWLRLLDVPTALRARSYGPGEPVVLAVLDAFIPANSGSYRITSAGAETCAAQPDLSLDVATLARIYLGDKRVADLAAAGLIEVHTPSAVEAADLLFVTPQYPWCGTDF